jgi:hypothetical protein
VSDRRSNDGGTKLSPQTLIVASLASLTAAIVTSTFWQKGTPITAALTPVIVAIASELYSRPAKRITELGSRAGVARTRRFQQDARQRERVPTGAPPEHILPEALRPPDEPELGPMRIYRAGAERPSPIRRVHIRAALITAVIAFAIAVAVLTLPELVFGGSVASHGSTTFFGGGHHRSHKSREPKNTQTAPTTSTKSPTTTTPTQSTPTVTAPPAQTTPQTTAPTQQPPAAGTPAPSPSPSTTTPAQTPPGQ